MVRLHRIWRTARRYKDPDRRAVSQCLPYIVGGLVIHAFGEFMGYLSGPRGSRTAYVHYTNVETERWVYTDPSICAGLDEVGVGNYIATTVNQV